MPQEQVSQPASQQTGDIGENSFRGCALPGTGTAEKTLGKSVAPKNKVGALCFLSDAFLVLSLFYFLVKCLQEY